MVEVRSLLALDCDAIDVIVTASKIVYENVGCDVFSGWMPGASEKVGYYYESLFYSAVARQMQVRKTYVDGVMPVTITDFSMGVLESKDVFGFYR